MIAEVFESQKRGRLDLSICFTGHRHLSAAESRTIAERLDAYLPALYRLGYRDFYCGGALGFDTLAAEAVLRMKETCPEARLILALPCSNQTDLWSDAACARYERLAYLADKTHVLSPTYYSGFMQVRNRFMVDRSRICIAYLTRMRGGTLGTVSYALDQDRTVLNLAMPDVCEKFLKGL